MIVFGVGAMTAETDGVFRRFDHRLFAPDMDHGIDPLFNEFQGIDHLGDTLSGQILEVAGLHHIDQTFQNFIDQAAHIGFGHMAFDGTDLGFRRFDRVQNVRSGFFGRGYHRIQFIADGA